MDDNGDFNVTTLDKFMEENFKEDKIDLIKIDVEGFEYVLNIRCYLELKKH